MNRIALALMCLACKGHGQREQMSTQHSSIDEGMQSLATLLLANNPTAAFNPSAGPSVGGRSGRGFRSKRRSAMPLLKDRNQGTQFTDGYKDEVDGFKLPEMPQLPFLNPRVPVEDNPIVQLKEIRKEAFMDWGQSDEEWREQMIVLYLFISGFLSWPIAYVTYYVLPKELPNLITTANIGTFPAMFIFLWNLRSKWDDIAYNLRSKKIVFEDEGFWQERKAKEEIQRDRLILQQEVMPTLNRIDRSLVITFGWSIASLILAEAVVVIEGDDGPVTPKALTGSRAIDFNNRLIADDEFAAEEQARARSRPGPNGKIQPTYCQSRYYKILAGNDGQGGMGCRGGQQVGWFGYDWNGFLKEADYPQDY